MKKYVITGSIGNISKPIVKGLVKEGNDVSVITRSKDSVKEIERLGAKALVGDVGDLLFLKESFKEAEVVYTMIPPSWQTTNWRASQNQIGKNYAAALTASHVKFVVNLSSIGAHLGNGAGPVDGVADFEQMLNVIPGLHVKHLRPSYFFSNFLSQIGMIKQGGIMGGNFGDGEKVFLVHPVDIAAAALEELINLNFTGNSVRYIIGDERSGQEIAAVLGKAIGRDLHWVVFTDEQQKQGLLEAGLSETHAQGFTDLGRSLREGYLQADARKKMPALATTKLEDFAREFALAFNA